MIQQYLGSADCRQSFSVYPATCDTENGLVTVSYKIYVPSYDTVNLPPEVSKGAYYSRVGHIFLP